MRFRRCGKGHGRGCRREEMHQHRLCTMQPGDSAVIRDLICEGRHRKRLMSLGMMPGRPITCVRSIKGTGICVRIDSSEFYIDHAIAQQVSIGGEE